MDSPATPGDAHPLSDLSFHIDQFRGHARAMRWALHGVCGVLAVLGGMVFSWSLPLTRGMPLTVALVGWLVGGVALFAAWAAANWCVAFADASAGGLWALHSASPTPGPALEVPLDETRVRLKRAALHVHSVCCLLGLAYLAPPFIALLGEASRSLAAVLALSYGVVAVILFAFGFFLVAGSALAADGPDAVLARRAGLPVDLASVVRSARRAELGGRLLSLLLFAYVASIVAMPAIMALFRVSGGVMVGLGLVSGIPWLFTLGYAVAIVGVALLVRAGARLAADATRAALGVESPPPVPPDRLRREADLVRLSGSAVASLCSIGMVLSLFFALAILAVSLAGFFGTGMSSGFGNLSTLFFFPVLLANAAVLWAFERYVKYGGLALSEGYASMPAMRSAPEGNG